MHRINRRPGELIYEQGENSHSAFLVLEGTVAMTRAQVVTRASKGGVIGFSGLFDRPYGSTATAETACTLLVFSRRELKALIRSNPVEADSIVEGIIAVLGEVAAALEARASELFPEATPPQVANGGRVGDAPPSSNS